MVYRVDFHVYSTAWPRETTAFVVGVHEVTLDGEYRV